jgi:hypothetical protein
VDKAAARGGGGGSIGIGASLEGIVEQGDGEIEDERDDGDGGFAIGLGGGVDGAFVGNLRAGDLAPGITFVPTYADLV